MTEFVPTEAQVRGWYATWPTTTTNTRVVPEYLAEFDRWLAQHDAEVRAKALREAAEGLRAGVRGNKCNPGCHEADQITLRLRADHIEKGAKNG